MSFFNDLGKKISEVAERATDKAKDLAEVTKLNYDISVVQKQMESDYAEIGKQLFATEKDNPDSPVASLCQKILAAQQTIAELNGKVQQIQAEDQAASAPPTGEQGKRFCSSCGAEMSDSVKFCPSCGTPTQ